MENDKNSILIVAGGGGGSAYYTNSNAGTGGSGGGFTGNNGGTSSNFSYGTGATQQAGGYYSNDSSYGKGSFGLGADTCKGTAYSQYYGAAGGGGYYGGGSDGGFSGSGSNGGGGGSGYIGNTLLTNKKMVCYNCTTSTDTNTYTESNTCVNSTATSNCSKQGNGYARITYLSDSNVEEKTLINYKLIPTYGTSIPSSIDTIYYTENGQSSTQLARQTANYTVGNFHSATIIPNNGSYIHDAPNGTQYDYGIIIPGENTFTMTENTNNSWIRIWIYGTWGTSTNNIRDLALNFADGRSYTIADAVTNGYIEPLVVYGHARNDGPYIFGNMQNTITGGSTDVSTFGSGTYFIKVKRNATLSSITFSTDYSWGSHDGILIYKMGPKFDLSLQPFTIQY